MDPSPPNMHHLASFTMIDTAMMLACATLTAIIFARTIKKRHTRATPLRGPTAKSFLFGSSRETFPPSESSHLYEEWERQYGRVYELPNVFGSKELILCDPKAIAHFFSRDTFVYRQTEMNQRVMERFFGRNLLWAEAEIHKRQRKNLVSAFSNAAIRELTPTFYNTAYALKAVWDLKLEGANESATIDVQQWMNRVTLDTIGMAGFSHDFESLKGKRSSVIEAFESFGSVKFSIFRLIVFLFAHKFPSLLKLPNKRLAVFKAIRAGIVLTADDLLEKARAERENDSAADGNTEKSIMGALLSVRSEHAGSMSYDEIIAQMYLFILAGYETTSISLTWALIELSRHPEAQKSLRAELQLAGDDPGWEQLTNSLPYLDAVVSETLRLHPAAASVIRQVHEDDIIPLSTPINDAHGRAVDHIAVAKGSVVLVPIMALNRSKELWGDDAKEFKPSRWMDNSVSQQKSAEIQGYHHLLTFIDGTRTCLGKSFALTEFKIVLSVLIRNYTFDLPDGPTTKIESHQGLLFRPKIAGQPGPNVPLVVRRAGP